MVVNAKLKKQPTVKPQLSPNKALERLMQGNERFAYNHVNHPHQESARRAALVAEQHPFATILACADSRVPPQLIFDQGLGDLFTNRVAGNLSDETIIASIAYSVNHLDVPLIMVLGHTGCGAVTLALEKYQHGESCSDPLSHAICPAIKSSEATKGDRLTNAIIENISNVVHTLKAHPEFKDRLELGSLKIVGGLYELETGRVKLV